MNKLAKPTLITLALSGAAIAGYLAYRVLLVDPHDEPLHAEAAATSSMAETLPDFSLENMDGELQSIQSFAGQPLLINFWATWCAPCLREIPLLKSLQESNPWLTVVGIAVDRRQPVLDFAANIDFNYPVLMGQSDAMDAAGSFGVDFFAMPFTIFTDAQGRMLGVHTGELHQEHLDNLVAVLQDLEGQRSDLADARARIAGLR